MKKEESEAGESKMLLESPTCTKKQNLPNKPPEGPKSRRWSGGDENVWHLKSETISEGNAGTSGLSSATGVKKGKERLHLESEAVAEGSTGAPGLCLATGSKGRGSAESGTVAEGSNELRAFA